MPREYKNQLPTAFQRRPHLTQSDDWIRAFLHRGQIAHIATVQDGQPFINPTSYWFDEPQHQIVFHSNVAGRVRSNVDINSKVCVEVFELGKFLPANVALEFSLQFRSVVVFGTTRLVTDAAEARTLLSGLIGKYFPRMQAGKEYRPITDKELRATSVYAIQIEAWSGKENWADRADQSDEWPALDEAWFE